MTLTEISPHGSLKGGNFAKLLVHPKIQLPKVDLTMLPHSPMLHASSCTVWHCGVYQTGAQLSHPRHWDANAPTRLTPTYTNNILYILYSRKTQLTCSFAVPLPWEPSGWQNLSCASLMPGTASIMSCKVPSQNTFCWVYIPWQIGGSQSDKTPLPRRNLCNTFLPLRILWIKHDTRLHRSHGCTLLACLHVRLTVPNPIRRGHQHLHSFKVISNPYFAEWSVQPKMPDRTKVTKLPSGPSRVGTGGNGIFVKIPGMALQNCLGLIPAAARWTNSMQRRHWESAKAAVPTKICLRVFEQWMNMDESCRVILAVKQQTCFWSMILSVPLAFLESWSHIQFW